MTFPDRTYKICPKCGNFTRASDPDHYCSLCGTAMIDHCVKCNEHIRLPHSNYCVKCGEPLTIKAENDSETRRGDSFM